MEASSYSELKYSIFLGKNIFPETILVVQLVKSHYTIPEC